MEIYFTCLPKILLFSSPFRRFEMKNFLHRSTMMVDHISYLVAPNNFFQFYGPGVLTNWKRCYLCFISLPHSEQDYLLEEVM